MQRVSPLDPTNFPAFEPGWVWLCGAGPGDPGLLTLHAADALRQADVLIYDALVAPEILDWARPEARRIYAGKRGGKPSANQADITARLIAEAKAGHRVLRLKGGDPLVFGRGGEEMLKMRAAEVPFRVIPGVSSGLGGLAYAGLPLTHRDVNVAVTLLTGHAASGALPEDIDWPALAKGAPVLVAYMAMKHLGALRDRLMDAGRAPNEPVALIENATLPAQRVIETELQRCVEVAAEAHVKPPALVVIGPIVSLRRLLDWWDPVRFAWHTERQSGTSHQSSLNLARLEILEI